MEKYSIVKVKYTDLDGKKVLLWLKNNNLRYKTFNLFDNYIDSQQTFLLQQCSS